MVLESGPLADVDPETASVTDLSVTSVERALESGDPLVRQHATDVCVQAAVDDPAAMGPFVDVLVDALDDESVVVVQKAAAALVPVAEAAPDAFGDAVDELVALYQHDVSTARAYGAKLLGTLAVERPALLVAHVDAVVDALDAPTQELDAVSSTADTAPVDDEVRAAMSQHDDAELKREQASRETVANVVVAVAEAHPEAVAPHLGRIADVTYAAPTIVAAAFVDAIATVAEADPDAARDTTAVLLDLLDHDHPMLRGRAIRALGFLGDDETIDHLRQVAAEDPDADVRSLAAETADFLEPN
ncbi:HEAT repeat domain-containing protein [Halorubellus salinus]|uniref:HEAT repeat domain-containing protein n=1 Tax=Halorubellus salinus TaxID=755309 RepID=UPI001D061E98|nr:HEAT repeat domain-containing protein [Halorubellus salinus]